VTVEEKKLLLELKKSGMGYKRISAFTGLPLGTVRTFFYRQASQNDITVPLCQQCGNPLKTGTVKRERRFCSDHCRMRWWAEHKDQMNCIAGKHLICPWCNKEFVVYGKKKRVYCSRDCYAAARKAKGEVDG